jgi:hypothetical protein
MQRHGGVESREGQVLGQYILLAMGGLQLVMLAQLLPGSDQRWVVFKAGQLLARLQQAPAQVAFA